jgi:hypothetical protein
VWLVDAPPTPLLAMEQSTTKPFRGRELCCVLVHCKLPRLPEHALEQLANQLEHLRQQLALPSTTRTPPSWHKRAADAHGVLREALLHLPPTKVIKAARIALYDLQEELYEVRVKVPVRRWHGVVWQLAHLYAVAHHAAFPQKPLLRLSNNGPVSRFCAAVIPRLTGETPTVGAVRLELVRQRKERKGNPAPRETWTDADEADWRKMMLDP